MTNGEGSKVMERFARLLFGNAIFSDYEEYTEFRFHFFTIMVWMGLLSSVYFLIVDLTGINPLPSANLVALRIHIAATMLIIVLLRSKRRILYPLIWFYGIVSFYMITVAFICVPGNELRIIWFFLNIPPYYIFFGRRVGVAASAASFVAIGIANHCSIAPYSRIAIVTFMISIAYINAFFFVYSEKSLSFFLRLRETTLRLKEQASVDPLTGILNTKAFYDTGNGLLHLARRNGSACSVLFIDLDHFKAINDSFGHETGDLVLKAVAHTLRAAIRSSDALGRVGGEEFSVLLPDTEYDHACRLGEKLRLLIESLRIDVRGQCHQVTASVGVATGNSSEISICDIQRRADQAMYRAKKEGRNRVCGLE
jgi:diguanylate cyclase (GGDEF)-like protein